MGFHLQTMRRSLDLGFVATEEHSISLRREMRAMFTHKVTQIFKTRKEIQGVLVLQKRNDLVLCHSDAFLYVLDALFYRSTATPAADDSQEGKVGLNQIFLFSSRIVKVKECDATDQGHIVVLTNEGSIWKLDLSDILGNIEIKEEKKCENSEGNSSDVFGALLQEDHCPANVKSSNQMKPKWPIKIGDNCKLIQNDHITDFFIINGEVVILMGSNDSIKLQMLTAVHNGMQCRTLLEILFQKPNSFMKYPLKVTYTNIIEQKGNPFKGSGIIELKRDLFCSLFSLRNALQKSLIFICGEQSGRVSICPFAIGSQEAVTYYSDAIDIFCDMGQPLLMVLPATIKEFCVYGMETISTRNKDAIEITIAGIKETLKNEDILVLIGSEGKIIIAMVPVKECMMSMFSMCHVSGPIVSGSILDDVLVYATHGSLHLSKLSVSLHVGDQQKLAISPSFKPVYSIMLPVTCISKHLISSPIRDSGINFYCADAEGWALGVMIDNTTDNMCRSDPTLNINFLLKTLENLQTDCNRWESLLKKQNSTLEELQVAASLTTAILDGTKRDDKITSQMSKSAVYCGFDSVSMGTDGVLYLDIRVHNDSDYVLPSNWFLQFVGEARQTTSNFQHGNLKQFSKIFSLHSLHPKTEMQIKSSINVKELQVTLPIEIEFKLAIPFHELCSTAEETASKPEKSYSILPLNSCIVTVLDILHLSDGECPKERANTADPLCHSYYFGLPCHFCYSLPACSSFDNIPNSCKKLSSNNLTIFSVPSLAVQSLLQDKNPEDFVKIIMAHLFPYNSHTSVLKYGTSLQLKLPCKQQARLSLVFDANNGKNSSTGVPRVQLEGCCLSLLLAIHSAILNRFKKGIDIDSPMEYTVPGDGSIQHSIETMQKRLKEIFPCDNFHRVQQCIKEMNDLLIGLRVSSFN